MKRVTARCLFSSCFSRVTRPEGLAYWRFVVFCVQPGAEEIAAREPPRAAVDFRKSLLFISIARLFGLYICVSFFECDEYDGDDGPYADDGLIGVVGGILVFVHFSAPRCGDFCGYFKESGGIVKGGGVILGQDGHATSRGDVKMCLTCAKVWGSLSAAKIGVGFLGVEKVWSVRAFHFGRYPFSGAARAWHGFCG